MNITLIPPDHSPDFWSGYTASPLNVPEDDGTMPYEIKGPKKVWGLMRNQPQPYMLFPVPEDFMRGSPSIKGVKWFKETILPDGSVQLSIAS